MDGKDVLKIEMNPDANDACATSVREYLINLLETLWHEQESFSGKRPFGNSGWDYELAVPLINAGVIKGKFDEDGCVEEVDDRGLYDTIHGAILALYRG